MEAVYGKELFEDTASPKCLIHFLCGSEITNDEVTAAIKRLRDNKSPGFGETYGDVLKLLNDPQIRSLTDLFKRINETEYISKDYLLSIFVPIPKRSNARKCEGHRSNRL